MKTFQKKKGIELKEQDKKKLYLLKISRVSDPTIEIK